MSASRRMWSRRILRAGWLLAPIFALPGNIWRGIKKCFKGIFYNYHGNFDWSFLTGMTVVGGVIGLFLFGLVFMTEQQNKHYENASPAELKAAVAADACVGQLLAQRLESGQSIKRYYLDADLKRCEDWRMVEQQKAALK